MLFKKNIPSIHCTHNLVTFGRPKLQKLNSTEWHTDTNILEWVKKHGEC